ncbi:hypothetical protein AAC03nite_13020 [Alicyclobacillus acidoterrestris]|uniref:hypothetical protein n=1 Tax=Alicyclobacillus suci TaxID=2816080 RepID=UPI001195FD72|nr:hypothetical protein [Alicyclobacillus suci]GEO25517.1 hypothetical protein AAC03nite_13020 [Alicyclobacillus acidoterrestris]
MVCREHLINALTRTHQALTACAHCIEESATEEEKELFSNLGVSLATQAKAIHEKLLDFSNSQCW